LLSATSIACAGKKSLLTPETSTAPTSTLRTMNPHSPEGPLYNHCGRPAGG
jgi:hypothetical protein